MSFNMDGYIDVAERIRIAKEQFPEMSLQSEIWFDDINGQPHVICKARFYRHPDDSRPGIGHAAEPIPGRTPYTRGSEVMNAETSAWGRAIGAVIPFGKVASADEVRNAKAPSKPQKPAGKPEVTLMDVKIGLAAAGATSAAQALEKASEILGSKVKDFDDLKQADLVKIVEGLK